MNRSAIAYWDARAEHWRISPPLAPAAEDIARYELQARECAAWAGAEGLPVVLLGVTAAIASMHWPARTSLLAVDWSAGMIAALWAAPALPGGAAVVRGDWRELPLPRASQQLVLGDGCYTSVGSPAAAAMLNREVHRVLRPGGRLCLRCFCRPETLWSEDQLFDALLAGRIRNLDLFRWLLTMCVQGDDATGVNLRSVWQAWHARIPEPARWQHQLGWTPDALANIERWATLDSRYWFASRAELQQLAEPYFETLRVDVPAYEYGELFPMLVFAAR